MQILDKGQLFTFGCGDYGVLGHGNTQNQYKPKLVDYFQ